MEGIIFVFIVLFLLGILIYCYFSLYQLSKKLFKQWSRLLANLHLRHELLLKLASQAQDQMLSPLFHEISDACMLSKQSNNPEKIIPQEERIEKCLFALKEKTTLPEEITTLQNEIAQQATVFNQLADENNRKIKRFPYSFIAQVYQFLEVKRYR